VDAGISRVVFGMYDPDSRVRGKGAAKACIGFRENDWRAALEVA